MDEEALISLVERHEELYNVKHTHYHNQQWRDSIWQEIGEILGENGKACKERWTKVRDNHRKALQLRKAKRGHSAMKMKPPKYNKELKFLIPYLHDDERSSNTEESDLNTQLSSVTSIPSPQCDSLDSQRWGAKRSTRTAKKTSTASKEYLEHTESICNTQLSSNSVSYTDELDQEYLKHRENIHNTQVNSNTVTCSDEQDPLIGFFINMARTVKSFPIQDQIKIKHDIFTIVNNTELRLAMQSIVPERSTIPYPMVNIHTEEFIVSDLGMRQDASTAAQSIVQETRHETVQNAAPMLSQQQVIQINANETPSVHQKRAKEEQTIRLSSQSQDLKTNEDNAFGHQTIQEVVEDDTTFLSDPQVKIEECECDLSPNSTNS